MSRLIDADKFIRRMNEELIPKLIEKYGKEEACRGLHFSAFDCIGNIEAQPTIDAVEVVRCENCKHCMTTDYFTSADEKYVTLYHCKLNDNVLKTNDDYCS